MMMMAAMGRPGDGAAGIALWAGFASIVVWTLVACAG
jgi:hypothetical protein